MTDNAKGLETTIRTLKMQCSRYAKEISKDVEGIERLKKERDWWKKELEKEIQGSFFSNEIAVKVI